MANHWDIIITNKSKLLSLDLHEVWRYRDLLAMYVKRDIITFYKQTILGPLWFVIQPLFTKTAYEIPLCDWSSDVCSSDLIGRAHV